MVYVLTDEDRAEAKRKAHEMVYPEDKLWLENLMKPVDEAFAHLAVIAILPAKCAAANLPWSTCERLMLEERDKITAIKESL